MPDWVGGLAARAGGRLVEAQACIASLDLDGAARLVGEALGMCRTISSAWAEDAEFEEESDV